MNNMKGFSNILPSNSENNNDEEEEENTGFLEGVGD